MLRFTCTCGKALKAPERLAGKTSRCPACGAGIVVPEPELALAGGEFALKPESLDNQPSWPTLPAPATSDLPRRTHELLVTFATIEDTATLAASPTESSATPTDTQEAADDADTYPLAAELPPVWVPNLHPQVASDYVPPAPFQRSTFEIWCDPLTGVKHVFYLSGFLALLTTIGVGLYPHVLHEGFTWMGGLFLATIWMGAMALLAGYGFSFLEAVLAYALCGGAKPIHVPDLDPRPAVTGFVRWGLAFACGPAILVGLAFRHWIYCGDVTVIDGLILVELTMPAISYWMLAMLVLATRLDRAWASPWQVLKMVRRLGLRALLAGIAATAIGFVHICVGAGAVILTHESWLGGLVILWFCWFSAWQCATYTLWTLGFWHYSRGPAPRARAIVSA